MNIGSVPPAPLPLPAGLNKTTPSPRPILFSLCLLLAALSLGTLVCSLGFPFLTTCFQPIPILDLRGLFALIIGLFTAVVSHEAGHLLAAIMNDFEVSGVCIGPF